MNQYDKRFLDVFNEYYPFERYIFNTPRVITDLFDDIVLTEIFVPYTETKPVCKSRYRRLDVLYEDKQR
jgi:hypothetical protein